LLEAKLFPYTIDLSFNVFDNIKIDSKLVMCALKKEMVQTLGYIVHFSAFDTLRDFIP
jgi:hypothetical protein